MSSIAKERQSKTAESQQIAEQLAPVVSGPAHSPTPWSFCGEKRGGCPCCTIFEATGSHPVAHIVSGSWGDDYPALRIVGGTFDQKVEAYSEQITYGEVDPEVAKANAAFIVRAVNSHEALVKALENMIAICRLQPLQTKRSNKHRREGH